jgi:hypothetical protein
MRGLVSLYTGPAGRCVTAVKFNPRSAAAFANTEPVDGFAVMKITPVPSLLW